VRNAGHDVAAAPIAVHSHGYVATTSQQAAQEYYPSYAAAMTRIGRERGWGPMTPDAFDAMRGPNGSLLLGSPARVAEKILQMREDLGIRRFMLHVSVVSLRHDQVLRSIELLGTEVASLVEVGVPRPRRTAQGGVPVVG